MKRNTFEMIGLIISLIVRVAAAAAGLNTGESQTLYSTDSLRNPGALYPMGGELPPSRVHHTATFVERYVIVFGGLSTDGRFMDDIHLFDTLTKTWSGPILKRLCCNNVGSVVEALGAEQEAIDLLPSLKIGLEGDLPSARAEHTAVNINGLLYVFGGLTAEGYMNDVYAFDPIKLRWSIIDSSLGPLPVRRAGHAAAERASDQYVVFGGRTGGAVNFTEGTKMLNDVWNFNSAEQTWTLLKPTSEQSPCPRQYAATVVVDTRLYVFGGYDALGDIAFNDVWAFELLSQTWTLLSPNSGSVQGYAPPPLYGSRLVPIVGFDGATTVEAGQAHQGFLVYGGIGGGGTCVGKRCKGIAVSIGQLYKFEVTLDAHTDNSTARILNSDFTSSVQKPVVYNYIKSSKWQYARLARDDESSESGDESVLRGKRTKRYVLEAVALSLDRKIMYEFGGLQAVDKYLIDNGQVLDTRDGVRRSVVPVFMDSGGVIDPLPSDLESGEKLRTSLDIPFNGFWQFKESFVRSQPMEAMTYVAFLNEFRTYHIHSIDIVHLFQQ